MDAHQVSWLPENFSFASLRNEAHVWCLLAKTFEDDISDLAETLSKDELARVGRFHSSSHKNNHIISQGFHRVLISHYLNVAPQDVRLQHNQFGKPSLDPHYHMGSDLRFNLSHSEDLLLFAFTFGSEIGVDCEHIRRLPDAEAIVERFFSNLEIECFAGLPEEQKELAFYTSWTRKEAYVKALGSGLSMPLNSFAVSIAGDEPARLLHVDGMPNETARWTLKSWEPAPGYIATVAYERADLTFRLIDLPA